MLSSKHKQTSKSKLGLGKLFHSKKDKDNGEIDAKPVLTRRNSSKRKISQFILGEKKDKPPVPYIWVEHARVRTTTTSKSKCVQSDVDSTSEESSSYHSKALSFDVDLLEEFESPELIESDESVETGLIESYIIPVPKGVTFCEPLVTQVGVGAGSPSFLDEDELVHGRPKAKVYQCEATLDFSYAEEKVKLPHYDRKAMLRAQPKKRVFLDNEELKQLWAQKEKLQTYRRKLLQKHQRGRSLRCQVKKELAKAAVVKANERQQRIIDQYKMAAPTSQDYRIRRAVKFGLAQAAVTVALVLRRQFLLQSIRQEAEERIARREMLDLLDSDGLVPQPPIRRQPVIVEYDEASNEGNEEEDSDDDASSYDDDEEEEDDDDDLDTDDFQFRRLEWAQISFLAAAKSQARRNVDC